MNEDEKEKKYSVS